MNKQNPGIGWCDYTWNPIKGLCPVGCWYCYARKMYKRFKLNPEIRYGYGKSERDRKLWHLLEPGTKIFICSTFELFHPSTLATLYPVTKGPDITYRDVIFETIRSNPHLTFQILTKMPENIDRPMPDNVWLGVSITEGSGNEMLRILFQKLEGAKRKFISFEPLLGRLNTSLVIDEGLDWVIVGRLTGHGKKHDPPKAWIDEIVGRCKQKQIPIFLKDNLKDIWGEDLIQEFPKTQTKEVI